MMNRVLFPKCPKCCQELKDYYIIGVLGSLYDWPQFRCLNNDCEWSEVQDV